MTTPTTMTTPDGRSLDVYLAGPADGDVLLFHMGTPSSAIPYPPTAEAMAERGLRYVAFNRPGYGPSTRRPGRCVADVVDDARAVLDHLGVASALTIGWSGGGPHALACGALLPDRIRAVACIASVAPYAAAGLDYLAGMGAENVDEFTAALESPEALIAFMERSWPIFRDVTGNQIAAAFGDLIDVVDRSALTGEFAAWLAADIRAGLRESYWGWFDDDMAFVKAWGFALDDIRRPVHVWQGRHDRMVPYAHGEWLAAHVPGAIPHLYEEHGHLSLAVDSMGWILDELVASGR